MNAYQELLFALIAFQGGAVDADRLTEACALWSADRTISVADWFVKLGCLTAEQKSQIEILVGEKLQTHGGDAAAALAGMVDGRFLEAIRGVIATLGSGVVNLIDTLAPVGDYEIVNPIGPEASEDSNRYVRTHLHAQGGMGKVWVARDKSLGRQIALKELQPGLKHNSTVFSRFIYEAKITAQLEHPGIVPVYELSGGEVPFYTMRFVQGRTLSEAAHSYHHARLAGTVDPLRLINLLNSYIAACQAVAYAHSKGVIHRDLKGLNIILGDFGEVIVLDWGIAKAIGETTASSIAQDNEQAPSSPEESKGVDSEVGVAESVSTDSDETLAPGGGESDDSPAELRVESGAGSEGTVQGQLLGTPGFMAPEQARGQLDQIDQRTDVYGLGAVLYEILTGSPPFDGKKTIEILQRVLEVPPRPPREINPTLDPALQAICLKALSKGKGQRYASATELAEDVQRYLADQPVHACPDPWLRRALRWARKHRTAVVTAAGLLVTTTIALGVGTVLVSRERNEAKFQGKQARQAVDDMYTKVAENWLEDRLDPLQKEFLEKTLAHYQTLTGQVAGDPAVRLEHGRAFQRMGDIHRKLGHLDEANDGYRRALSVLEPLYTVRPDDAEVRRALVLTETRLGDLMVRRGQNDQAEPLYQHALVLYKGADSSPALSVEDRWLMANTLKSQADLLRRKGDFKGARSVYEQAISLLDNVLPAPSYVRNDLALAEDALGQLLIELGESKAAETAFQRALALLEPLVAEFPTIPRFRESLAKVCNSLGIIEQTDRAADSELHYRRELAEVERLSRDFPDRPEFRRALARTCTNLGGLLIQRGRSAQAEPLLRRGIALNAALNATQPGDAQVRLDLARSHNNLGYLQLQGGQTAQSLAEFTQARNMSQALVKQFPDSPRYRLNLASDLRNLGRAYQAAGQPAAEPTFQDSLKISEKLVREFPANSEYQLELGRCLNSLGALLAATQPAQAESFYLRGLAVLRVSHAQDSLREQASMLSNLGELRRSSGRAGAEESLRQSIAISEELVARKPAAGVDRQTLAIAQNNLGEALEGSGRNEEAGELFSQSIAGLDRLAVETPKAIDTQNYLGYIYDQQAKLQDKMGQKEKARQSIEAAVAHQQQAVKLTEGKIAGYRVMLAGHFELLAKICIELSAYDDAIRAAIEMSKAAPPSGKMYMDAARLLVHCMDAANKDEQLTTSRREEISRQCSGRIVVLLREALDVSTKARERIKADPELAPILARPEFQSLFSAAPQQPK